MDVNIYFLLLNMAEQKGVDAFIEMPIDAIKKELETELKPFLPESPTPMVDNG